jgi:hypothetical protein
MNGAPDKATAINNCFDEAFKTRKGVYPDNDLSMDKDYHCGEPDVLWIFKTVKSCLAGQSFNFVYTPALINKCESLTVIGVKEQIGLNTPPPPPAASAAEAAAAVVPAAKKPRRKKTAAGTGKNLKPRGKAKPKPAKKVGPKKKKQKKESRR